MLQLYIDPQSSEQMAVVRCSGRIVFQDEAQMLSEAVSHLMNEHEKVVIDLSEVHSIDSAGLGTLASLYVQSREQGRSLVLLNPARFVREVLELTRLDSQLTVTQKPLAAMNVAA